MKIYLCFHPRQISKTDVERSLPCIIDVMRRYNISLAYIFGSILLEETKAQDLDIGIYIKDPERDITDHYNDVYFDICDIFGADNIDIVVINNVGPVFRFKIIKTGRLIYFHAPEIVEEFIEETLFKYEDIKLFKKEYRKELYKGAKEGILMNKRKK